MITHAAEIKRLMDVHKLKLSVAESITTGNLQAAIGSVSGSSTYFEGGMTVYSRKQKVAHLGVNNEHAKEVNSVSARVAEEMARGVCLKYDADIGVGTTGYAEAYPEENVSMPHGFFAIWRRQSNLAVGQVVVVEHVMGEGLRRVEMQRHMTEEVLKALLGYLQDLETSA
jgi:nicotinamide-nucleotide amidase